MDSEEDLLVVVARCDRTQPIGDANSPSQTSSVQEKGRIDRQQQQAQGAAPWRPQDARVGDFEADVTREDRLVEIEDDGLACARISQTNVPIRHRDRQRA
jgi:uncharacterized protein (DUF2235 family)